MPSTLSVRLQPSESHRLEMREEFLLRQAVVLFGDCGPLVTCTILGKCYFRGFGIYSKNDGLPLKLGCGMRAPL